MRLRQIKLAGFKSFVDPTTFEVPSRLVGVVGPNGCGKSNIIDAVRWVLGETRASELRGESMQDVIFNGSSDRKPSARASVELLFDNTLSRLGGAWAGYAEISVKRVLGRDGQSTYLVNNQVVRRKDVHDMFLGTGLGPRAYAIIGQGTVSRLIEARPEELRVFLEEAAGVSRYKERRRETENRLADTRENLLRVDDILRELVAQIEKLERQAEVAQTFRTHEAERDTKQRMLWLVRRDEALAEQARIAAELAELALQADRELAAQRAVEAELASSRAAHDAAGDAVHRQQGAYYEANAEVARLENDIRYVADARRQLDDRLAALDAQAQAARERDAQAADALSRSAVELDAARERRIGLERALADAQAQIPALEERLRAARDVLDATRTEAADTSQALQVSATRRHGLEQRMAALTERIERLAEQLGQVAEPPSAELEALNARLGVAARAEEEAGARAAASDARWHELDEQRAPAQAALRAALEKLAQVDARTQALRQLQERVQSQGKTQPWLREHGLEQLRRVWQRLRIESGWETAVEAVLRERVQSLEVTRLGSLVGLLGEHPPARVGFHAGADVPPPAAGAAPPGLVPLAGQVHTGDPALAALLDDWLHGCFCAEDAAQAMADRGRLPAGGRFVLRGGHEVGRLAVQLYAPDSEQDGVLVRQHELDNLAREQRALALLADDGRVAADRADAAAAQARATAAADRDTLAEAVRQAAALRLEAERCTQQVERATADRTRLEAELAEARTEHAELEAQAAQAGAEFESLDLQLAGRQEAVESRRLDWEGADSAVGAARDRLRDLERDERAAAFEEHAIEVRRQSLHEQIEQARQQVEQALGETEILRVRLAELSDEAARTGLQAALQTRVQAEQALGEARARLEALGADIRRLDETRLGHERAQEPLRVRHTEWQLKEQAARLGAEQFATQLAEAGVDEPAVRAAFADPPKASWLQGEVTRLTNAIAALGAVNLAALDELTASRERRAFLDAQAADLNQAIATLEDAIRRIDRETRALLQETFDTVNGHFGTLFPELFGGGEARLVLTGEEILDSGLVVVAQPPGKRNSTIHQLSGGEKALTAIALVFGMFQLNPAPFCLLDEVDAPLDDANTERYCAMVRRMSAQTQFLFVTHNKIAMELADRLVGVTMQERGVSRIVAVDLESAARFAEAA